MPFPTGTISTSNLDSSADDPSLARADIYNAVVALNTIIDEGGDANGVCLLDSTGKIPVTTVPTNIQVTGDLVLQPSSGVVNVRDVLRLTAISTADSALLAGTIAGDIIYCSDGDAGDPCLAVYDGTNWLRVSLGAAIATS